jgi:hypothetical protein
MENRDGAYVVICTGWQLCRDEIGYRVVNVTDPRIELARGRNHRRREINCVD